MRLLLRYGADPLKTDNANRTPASVAVAQSVETMLLEVEQSMAVDKDEEQDEESNEDAESISSEGPVDYCSKTM